VAHQQPKPSPDILQQGSFTFVHGGLTS